jgi:hypothetical protein
VRFARPDGKTSSADESIRAAKTQAPQRSGSDSRAMLISSTRTQSLDQAFLCIYTSYLTVFVWATPENESHCCISRTLGLRIFSGMGV